MQKRCICSFVIDEFGFLSSFVIRASSWAPAGLLQITHDTSSAKITLKTSHPASLARRRTRCRNRALHNRYAFSKASSRRCARRTDDQRRGERREFFRLVKCYQLHGCKRCLCQWQIRPLGCYSHRCWCSHEIPRATFCSPIALIGCGCFPLRQ